MPFLNNPKENYAWIFKKKGSYDLNNEKTIAYISHNAEKSLSLKKGRSVNQSLSRV